MIKKVTVVECDICGKTEFAKDVRGRYNETEYTIPDNWKMSKTNEKFCICDECLMKLNVHDVNYRSEQIED